MKRIRYTKKITSALVFAIVFALIPAFFEILNNNTQAFFLERKSSEDFFVYYKIEPVKRLFSTDEELKFISFSEVKKPLNFIWNDILRCNYDYDDTSFVNVGSQNTQANDVSLGENKISTWVWDGTKPQQPADCVIEANITAEVGYGVTKTQKIISDDFRIE